MRVLITDPHTKFQQIGQRVAELLRLDQFSRWPSSAILDFLCMLDRPRRCFDVYAIRRSWSSWEFKCFVDLSRKTIGAHFSGFWVVATRGCQTESNQWKHIPGWFHAFWAFDGLIPFGFFAVHWKTNKRRYENSQKDYISAYCGELHSTKNWRVCRCHRYNQS